MDMIVQNMTGPGRAELSFTVPRADLTRALKRTQDVVREIDPACRVVGDADMAVLFVLGVGMRTHTGVARTMFGALAERGINIAMINTSEVCVGVVVEESRAGGGAGVPERGVQTGLTRTLPGRPRACYISSVGEVAEWLNASVSKTDLPARVTRVRIPPSPLRNSANRRVSSFAGAPFPLAVPSPKVPRNPPRSPRPV